MFLFQKVGSNAYEVQKNKANLATFESNELMSSDVYGDRESVTAGGFSDIDKAASTMGRDIDSLKSDHKDIENTYGH